MSGPAPEKYGPEPLTNKGIKDRLNSVGFDTSKMHANYYYTATKRLSDRGIIVKHEDGSYSLPKEKAAEELPAKDASAALFPISKEE